jgi:hypothetical protein
MLKVHHVRRQAAQINRGDELAVCNPEVRRTVRRRPDLIGVERL